MKTALRRTLLHRCGRTPLVAAFATVFALAAPAAMATVHVWTVNTCNEGVVGVAGSYTGSLRFAANNALDGDTIDMTGLDLICSHITLQTGAIVFAQNDLTVNGPGTYDLSISCERNAANGYLCTDRIFDHTGSGELQVSNLMVSDGHVYSKTNDAEGGCIYSSGSQLYLNHVVVEDCTVGTSGQQALGGGIFAKQALTLKYSNVRYNIANGGGVGNNPTGVGGGAVVAGNFTMVSSTINNNQALTGDPTANEGSLGGGLVLLGNVDISDSTISGNYSDNTAGGIFISPSNPMTTTIVNSTISGNRAANFVGGLFVNSETVKLYNSTITFNTAGQGSYDSGAYKASPGMAISANSASMNVTLKSSLLANNTYGASPGVDNDLSANAVGNTITFNAAPANNLVYGTFIAAGTLPSDTLSDCPLLGPLSNNGGLTQTHALLSHSPGIGVGNNSQGLKEDQRGRPFIDTAPYPYPRVSPTTSKADIGAYEVQQADIIFNNGFDGCQ